MKLRLDSILPLALLISLTGCGSGGGRLAAAPVPRNGPAADFPVVIGDPYSIAGTIYSPADRLNSDEVGHALVGEAGGGGVSAAHKTLPLPSYAEVTALDTGRTILVRLERRGPMNNDEVIELSPGAAAQLEIGSGAPVRVRRVNPPEQERAMLRNGGRVPERMETPKGLLAVLKRKLEASTPLSPAMPKPSIALASAPKPKPAEPLSARPLSAPASVPESGSSGAFTVQVAAFSTEDRARNVAGKLGGKVMKPGRYWLTRLGPFNTRSDTEAALAKARSAGYSDARILRAD